MQKFSILIFCFISIAITACSKLSSTEDTTSASNILTKLNSTSAASALSLVIPDTAVNAKKFGAYGDGLHDDTEILQKLINTQKAIFLPAGTYLISKTLNFKSNVKIYGTTGATVASGKKIGGTLLTNGRFISLYEADNCLIYNITFESSGSVFSFSEWSNACIYVADSKGTNIISNTFNFEFKFGKAGMEAMWFTGSRTENTVIKGNKLYTVGIEYAEAGASTCLVDSNYVKNAHGVAINGHGNSDQTITGIVISNNIVEYPGYIGIEDWGNTGGTVIKNNTVSHTGQDNTKIDAMGISAVGGRPQILNNTINDAKLYYIEVGGTTDKLINGNIINDTKRLATGIIINYTADEDNKTNANRNVVITNNQINNCDIGISYYGKNNITTELRSNKISNTKSIAVNIDSNGPMIAATIADNTILFTTPATKTRVGFLTYTRLPSADAKHSITYTNNSIEYTSEANGNQLDYGFSFATNNTVMNNNSIKSAISNIYAVNNVSDNVLNLYLTNSNFKGVKNDLSRFNLLTNTGNVITK